MDKFVEWPAKALIYVSMVVVIFLGITIFYTCIAQAKTINCTKHPIYCQIVNNKPSIDKPYAMKLSNVIHKKTQQYNINPVIFTAILAQESMYNVTAQNCTIGLVLKYKPKIDSNKILDLDKSSYLYEKARVCTDFGISQIHYGTVKAYNFKIKKLIWDLDYSVEAGAKVLNYFKRYQKKEKDWWTRYNSPTRVNRDTYKRLVERFF